MLPNMDAWNKKKRSHEMQTPLCARKFPAIKPGPGICLEIFTMAQNLWVCQMKIISSLSNVGPLM